MKKMLDNTIDSINDGIEKVSSPSSRAGWTVQRVGVLLEDGLSPKVIALQMTENSPTKATYTSSEVIGMGKLYEDSKTKVVLTAKQTRALINDQKTHSSTQEHLRCKEV